MFCGSFAHISLCRNGGASDVRSKMYDGRHRQVGHGTIGLGENSELPIVIWPFVGFIILH